MFRALCAHHQVVKIVSYSIWYHHTCRWPSGVHRLREDSLSSFLHSPVTSSLLGPNIFLIIQFSKNLVTCSFLSVKDRVSHPCKTTGKIMFPYIWSLYFWAANRKTKILHRMIASTVRDEWHIHKENNKSVNVKIWQGIARREQSFCSMQSIITFVSITPNRV